MTPARNIADILAEKGVLTKKDLEKVKLEEINTGKPVKEILKEFHLADEEQIAQAEGELWKVPYVNLAETPFSPQALNFLSQAVAEEYNVIPFQFDSSTNELAVALENPLDLDLIKFLEKKTGTKIKPHIASPTQIKEAIESHYGQSLVAEIKATLGETKVTPQQPQPTYIPRPGEVLREEKIARVVNIILEFAVKSRASDIHIEPQEENTRVRYRIDGILHEKLVLPKYLHDAVVSRVKILSGMRIDEKRVPQDGRFSFKAEDQEIDLRVSSLPTVHGEKIVMRLLKKTGQVPDLPELGLRGRALKDLQEAILRPHGIIIVCGPTGSGKTTTLYSVLSRINTPRVNIITLEDPVEYEIPGVNQVQVNPAAGLTFASGMRSFLRQDPNIIMVGEIRDRETTELAVQASLTGHLVFSTLHTNNAAQAIPRLLDLGAEPFLLASSVTCLVAQRICRRICPDCKEEYSPPPEVIEDIKKVLGKLFPPQKETKLYRGKKCATCNNTGYLGRIGIFEVLPISEKIARLILERASAREIEKQAREEGMVTMKQDGYLKVLEGITTIEEVLRVAQE
ncbi:MAG: GspE/PulE family protein [Microgenomates group bacterium]